MATFHSQTDKTDLHETAFKLPMYLSLVVNYKCETDCELAIAMEVEEKILTVSKWKLRGWKDNKRETKITRGSQEKTVYVMKCDVEYEQPDTWFSQQIDLLKQKKSRATYPAYNPVYGGGNIVGFNKDKWKKTESVIEKGASRLAYTKMIDSVGDLISLGSSANPRTAPLHVLREVDSAVSVPTVADYQKALKFFFIDEWWYSTHAQSGIDVEETLTAILTWLEEIRGHYWITNYLKETFNELKESVGTLRTIQGAGVV